MVDGTKPRYPGEESLFMYSIEPHKKSVLSEQRLSTIKIAEGLAKEFEMDEIDSIEEDESEMSRETPNPNQKEILARLEVLRREIEQSLSLIQI